MIYGKDYPKPPKLDRSYNWEEVNNIDVFTLSRPVSLAHRKQFNRRYRLKSFLYRHLIFRFKRKQKLTIAKSQSFLESINNREDD